MLDVLTNSVATATAQTVDNQPFFVDYRISPRSDAYNDKALKFRDEMRKIAHWMAGTTFPVASTNENKNNLESIFVAEASAMVVPKMLRGNPRAKIKGAPKIQGKHKVTKRGINRPLQKALNKAFDGLSYEVLVKGKQTIFFLRPSEFDQIRDVTFKDVDTQEIYLGGMQLSTFDWETVHVDLEAPHKVSVIFWRDENGRLGIPHPEGFIPLDYELVIKPNGEVQREFKKLNKFNIEKITGTVGVSIRSAFYDGQKNVDNGNTSNASARQEGYITLADKADVEEIVNDRPVYPRAKKEKPIVVSFKEKKTVCTMAQKEYFKLKAARDILEKAIAYAEGATQRELLASQKATAAVAHKKAEIQLEHLTRAWLKTAHKKLSQKGQIIQNALVYINSIRHLPERHQRQKQVITRLMSEYMTLAENIRKSEKRLKPGKDWYKKEQSVLRRLEFKATEKEINAVQAKKREARERKLFQKAVHEFAAYEEKYQATHGEVEALPPKLMASTFSYAREHVVKAQERFISGEIVEKAASKTAVRKKPATISFPRRQVGTRIIQAGAAPKRPWWLRMTKSTTAAFTVGH